LIDAPRRSIFALFALYLQHQPVPGWPGEMSKNTKYLFVSVPSSITPSGHKDDAIQALQRAANDYATVSPFPIPEFKIGTLDALIQQSEELAKLAGTCEGVVSKVGDSLRNILEGDEGKIAQQKTVNDSLCCPGHHDLQ
jgi:V-type H+-transporting ATPase subunit C